jgi:hypothetical protein
VQLDSLQLEGTALVWWERKLHDISKCGNLLSSWSEFKIRDKEAILSIRVFT